MNKLEYIVSTEDGDLLCIILFRNFGTAMFQVMM